MARGVPPLRAGQGHSFFWRRLHSLTGIVPVGAFLVEHFISNAFATNGPHAYAEQVKFLSGLPFVPFLELFGIYLPLAYHAFYGFYIWFRGTSNVTDYPWQGNFMYAAQRWTGADYVYLHRRGTHTPCVSVESTCSPTIRRPSTRSRWSCRIPGWPAFYLLGIIAASWHFAYGLFLFAAKWGITVSDRSRKAFGYVCLGIAALFIVVGFLTLGAFFKPQWRNTPEQLPGWQQTVERSAK